MAPRRRKDNGRKSQGSHYRFQLCWTIMNISPNWRPGVANAGFQVDQILIYSRRSSRSILSAPIFTTDTHLLNGNLLRDLMSTPHLYMWFHNLMIIAFSLAWRQASQSGFFFRPHTSILARLGPLPPSAFDRTTVASHRTTRKSSPAMTESLAECVVALSGRFKIDGVARTHGK